MTHLHMGTISEAFRDWEPAPSNLQSLGTLGVAHRDLVSVPSDPETTATLGKACCWTARQNRKHLDFDIWLIQRSTGTKAIKKLPAHPNQVQETQTYMNLEITHLNSQK